MIGLVKVLSKLPLSILYIFSDILFFITYYVVRYRKKLVYEQIKIAFPSYSESQVHHIVKEFYKNLADFAVEVLKIHSISKEQLIDRVKFTNLEIVNQFKDQPTIYMASHQFNWEWMQLSASLQIPFELDYIYQKLQNKTFDKFVKSLRSKFGSYAIEKENSAREIVMRKDKNRGYAMVADQIPWRHSKKYWTQFLGRETAFYIGTEMLAKLIKCPVLYLACRKVKRGYYEVEIQILKLPPHDKHSHDILDSYIDALQRVIEKQPENWLWSHKRWKYTKEQHP